MGSKSTIEWTDASWNAIRGTKGRWTCQKLSPGCTNCYSERMNHRFAGPDFVAGADQVRLDEHILRDPIRWQRPRKIFVCSMTDLFWDRVPEEWVHRIFGVMYDTPKHVYQVLTKRSERMRKLVPHVDFLAMAEREKEIPREHIWLGVSVEDQKRKARIDDLKKVIGYVRFLSVEPLLEDLGTLDLTGISWVILGSESGPKARPMEMDWARRVRDQAKEAGAAFFFKQAMIDKKLVSLPELDGRQWAEFPKVA